MSRWGNEVDEMLNVIRSSGLVDSDEMESALRRVADWSTGRPPASSSGVLDDYADQFAIDVHGITPQLSASLVSTLGAPGAVAFVTALGFTEGRARANVVLGMA